MVHFLWIFYESQESYVFNNRVFLSVFYLLSNPKTYANQMAQLSGWWNNPVYLGSVAAQQPTVTITFNRFVLNIVKSHHPLLYNFKCSNIKAAIADHPIIQKEKDELFGQEHN